MSASQAVCHLYDALASSEAPSPSVEATGALARFPVKQLVIYVLPWPRGRLQSPPDLLVTQPGRWDEDVERLVSKLDAVGARGPVGEWPTSEVFGRLSAAEWGALLRTHLHHHLRQFGV